MTSSRTNISHDLVTIGEQITTLLYYYFYYIIILYIALYVTYIRSTDAMRGMQFRW